MKKRIRITESDIRKIVKSVINEEVVNYQSDWSDEGTHFSQTIRIGLTQADLDNINNKMASLADSHDDERRVFMLNKHEVVKDNIKKPLHFGKNYLKLSQLYALANILNWKEYKRIKMDRNTILDIVQI